MEVFIKFLQEYKKQVLIIIGVVFFVFLFFMLFRGGAEDEEYHDYIPPYGYAALINGEELYKAIGPARTASLRKDIKFFARKRLDVYKDFSKEVVFIVEGIQNNEQQTVINGKFELLKKQPAKITIKKLNHQIIQTYIEAAGTNSQNLELPSFGKTEAFIGSLPQKKKDFTVDYLERSETFYVTFNGQVNGAKIEAVQKYLKEKLPKDLSEYNFSMVGFDKGKFTKYYFDSFQVFE